MAAEPPIVPPAVAQDGFLRVGSSGGQEAAGWAQARSRCTACGSQGLLSEGYLEDTGEGAKGYVRWVGGPRDTSFFGGWSTLSADRFLVRAFRCRECNHLELFAEPNG